MKKPIVAAGFVFFSFLFPLQALAQSFEKVYIFGDSLSDTGNVHGATFDPNLGIGLPPPPYFPGRFSNGFVWLDYFTQDLGLTPTPFINVLGGTPPTDGINFAFGGATSGIDNTINQELLGLQEQLIAFSQIVPSADADALYIVWAGANDYLPTESSFVPFTTPNQSIANISFAVNSLATAGAKNIMVVNLPELGKLPLTLASNDANRLNTLTQEHNQLLASLEQTLNPDINLISLDVNSLFNQVLTNPQEFGFTNVTDACIFNPECRDNPTVQNQYFFWDIIHPTTAAHQLIGNLASEALEPEPPASVPEPTSVVALLAFGALGTGSMLKRKQKTNSTKSRF